MRAIERAMEDKARNHSANWTSVLCGQSRVTIDPSEYNVSYDTFRKQANAEGFRTQRWGEEIQLYR